MSNSNFWGCVSIGLKISLENIFSFSLLFQIFSYLCNRTMIALRLIILVRRGSFMIIGKVAYAVLSMAESQKDKAVQSEHWVGDYSPDIMKAFTRRCV